eukprot:1286595-Rhodomonas_salina.2
MAEPKIAQTRLCQYRLCHCDGQYRNVQAAPVRLVPASPILAPLTRGTSNAKYTTARVSTAHRLRRTYARTAA